MANPEQVQRFYIFHSDRINGCSITEIEDNEPTEIEQRYVYHENTNIVRSYTDRLGTIPIHEKQQMLMENFKPYLEPSSIVAHMILYPGPGYITPNNLGKWIMYFQKSDGVDGLNTKWKECCKLYNEEKLTGIVALMCNTNFQDVRHDGEIGVIFFFCDENGCREYGENLLTHISYYGEDNNPYMYYKTYADSFYGSSRWLDRIPLNRI